MVLAFDNNIKQQIKKKINYANLHIYQVDDILDMINGQMTIPGEISEHLILIPIGRWICYYIVDHPQHGRCHFFQIKPDASGRLPTKIEIEYILKEFGIENTLLDEHISIGKTEDETKVILPISI
jgi:hypothetical protein